MYRSSRITTCHVASWLVFGLLFPVGLSAAELAEERPMVIRPQNTVLVAQRIDNEREPIHWLRMLLVHAFGGEGRDDTTDWFRMVCDTDAGTLGADINLIALGRTRLLTDQDRADAQGYTGMVRRRGNVVVLTGTGCEGRFLDKAMGIRLYAPSGLWLSRPIGAQVEIPAGFEYRYHATLTWQSAGGDRLQEDTAAGNLFHINLWEMLNAPPNLPLWAPHNVSNYFPPEQYYDTHRHFYEMDAQGERPRPSGQHWHPCFSAPGLAAEAARSIIARREQPGNHRVYESLFLMDTAPRCQCADCQASVKEHGGYSQLYHNFVIDVAQRVQERFPNVLFTATGDYAGVSQPPKDRRFPGNVVVKFVLKTYQMIDGDVMSRRLTQFQAYFDRGAKWFGHDWVFGGISPRDEMNTMGRFLTWAASHGMVGTRVEWSNGENWYLDGPRYWILTQLYWDPTQDVPRLRWQYAQDMYGPSAKPMFALFEHYAALTDHSHMLIELGDMPRQESARHSPQSLAYERSLLRDARELAGDDPLINQRLDVMERYFRGHELFAMATYFPYHLNRGFMGTGLNHELLAHYLRESGNPLSDAIAYYDTQRTVPPDTNERAHRFGLPSSVHGMYTQPLGGLLQAIREQALREVDLSGTVDAQRVAQYVAACKRLLRQQAPQDAQPQQLSKFEWMLEQVLYVPTVDRMPPMQPDLSDPLWEQAAKLDDFRARDTLELTPHRTTGRIMRVGDHLVIGLENIQEGGFKLVTPADQGATAMLHREASAEFFYGPPDQAKPAQVIVNALGAFRAYGDLLDVRDGIQVVTRLDQDKGTFTMVVALPLRAGKMDYTKLPALSFNIMRNVYTTHSGWGADYITGWHPVFYTAHDPRSRGLIFIR